MYCENLHASIVVGLTTRLWLPIQISFEMEKGEALKLTTTERQLCALNAIPNWIKGQNCPNQKE